MTVTLGTARTRTLALVDDAGQKRFGATVLDEALKAALQLVYLRASRWAPERFALEGSLTTNSSGQATLTSLTPDPLRILGVSLVQAQHRYPLPAASQVSGLQEVQASYDLKVSFLPVVTFPASSGDNFVWGQSSAIGLDLLDELLCLEAASLLKPIEGEANNVLEAQRGRLEREARDMLDVTSVRELRLTRATRLVSRMRWLQTDATTIQLVR